MISYTIIIFHDCLTNTAIFDSCKLPQMGRRKRMREGVRGGESERERKRECRGIKSMKERVKRDKENERGSEEG